MDADTYFVRSLGCQWLGADYDPRKHSDRLKPTPYCGCKELVGESMYCQEHYARMYVKGSALRKRKKDIRTANSVWDLESDMNAAVEELIEEGWDL